MAKQDIFASAVEDEDDDAPQVQANEPAPEPEDEEVAAPQPPQGTNEPQAAESAAQPDQAQPQPQLHQVPLTELLNTRERAQAAERERDELRRRMEDFERQQRAAAQQRPQEVPDVFADPNAYTQHLTQSFQQSIQEMRLEMNFEIAKVRHGETFDRAFPAWVEAARQSPPLYYSAINSPSPGDAIVDWYKRENVLREVGSDPAAYRQKLQDELLNDPAFLQQVVERVRQPAAPSQGTRPQTSVRLPPSLNRLPSAAGANEDVDGSRDGIWAAATRGR